MDLCAAIKEDQVLPKGSITVIPTGIAIALPPGLEAQIRPRSGLAFKHGIGILGKRPYTISRGDRIAQMVIQRICQVQLDVVEALQETDRNEGGFGHTGM
jgi:dUTP pyrophosphatase